MEATINSSVLKRLSAHHRSLGLKYQIKGLPYERCAELTWVIQHLEPHFSKPLNYLDIGTGESPLPSFLLENTGWNITCLDKCEWVNTQRRFSRPGSRFQVLQADLLHSDLPEASFDLITCISVIEHFEGSTDTAAMRAMARLLTPGGRLILTTLINEPYYAEFYLQKTVYGDEFQGAPVFYQRHYDLKGVQERLVDPSGLLEKQRVYFGDYGFQCFERVLQQPKPVRALYAWNTPWFAKKYLSYREYPVSRKDMRMNTASGLILVLEKQRDVQN
jgi:SAM-dependent methyltransferase